MYFIKQFIEDMNYSYRIKLQLYQIIKYSTENVTYYSLLWISILKYILKHYYVVKLEMAAASSSNDVVLKCYVAS